jgi:hypothetical protein
MTARALILLASSIALVGCSDDGLAKRYPVSGTVTYKGQPLAKGEITLMPTDPAGRGGVGVITDGAYQITTQTPNDGAFPGDYNVLVTALDIDKSAADAATKKSAEKAKVEASQPDQAAMAKALATAKSSIPTKYGQVASSGLKAKVEQKSNTFNFDLVD